MRLGGKSILFRHKNHCVCTGLMRESSMTGMKAWYNPVRLHERGRVEDGEGTTQRQTWQGLQVTDYFPFLLRASKALSMVEGKEDCLRRVMSRHTVIIIYNYFLPELLFILVVLHSFLCILLSTILILPSLVLCGALVSRTSNSNFCFCSDRARKHGVSSR